MVSKFIQATLAMASVCSFASLQGEVKVLAFSGSTRQDSSNQKLVAEAASLASGLGAKVVVVNLRDYPIAFYDEDYEKSQGMPPKAIELRNLMMGSDVVFIATPEYNSAVSSVLKNALDWMSRTEDGKPSRDAYKGKRFLLLSASPGSTGGARAVANLKSIIEDIGGAGTVLEGTFSLPHSYNAFDASGKLSNADQRKTLQELVKKAVAR